MTTMRFDERMAGPRRSRRSKPVLVVASVLLVVAGLGVFAFRVAAQPAASNPAPAASLRYVPVPSSPAIEAAWGIRFTAVLLEADRGLLDLRYEVVDPAKSGRIHGGTAGSANPEAQLASLPSFVLESNGKTIVASSAMMHFEHFHFQTELLGSTYSMIYGNAGGLLHLGDKVTIKMADGLKLMHVVVGS